MYRRYWLLFLLQTKKKNDIGTQYLVLSAIRNIKIIRRPTKNDNSTFELK